MQFIRFDAVDSTQLAARRAIAAGNHPPGPHVYLARRQTSGHGRLGRAWSSPIGGVWMTLCLPLAFHEAVAADIGIRLGLTVRNLCAAEARRRGVADPVLLKWPNDIMIGDRKLAGLLTEVTTYAGVTWILVGVGINLSVNAADWPADVRARAATLDAASNASEAEVLSFAETIADACAAAVARRSEPMPNLMHAADLVWRTGSRVKVSSRSGPIEGVVLGIAPSGELMLTTATGPTLIRAADELAPSPSGREK